MGWVAAIVFVVALVIGVTMMPTSESVAPAEFEDIDAPTAEVGREIPVLFGTRKISGSNVVWYGHMRLVAVKSDGGKK